MTTPLLLKSYSSLTLQFATALAVIKHLHLLDAGDGWQTTTPFKSLRLPEAFYILFL